MRIVALSDLHGVLPAVPPCDLCLIAGDLCPVSCPGSTYQCEWLHDAFRPWLQGLDARGKFYIAGNHDFFFQESLNPPDLGGVYLQDGGAEFEGLKLWGSPWQPVYLHWAFNLPEEELAKKWALIPVGTDILLTHGPPQWYGDLTPSYTAGRKVAEHVGSPSLLERVRQVRPKLHVFGHVHEGRGWWQDRNTILANVTILNGRYQNVYRPMLFEYHEGRVTACT